eukprot:TRINITY_DN1307_c0_g13_i1.p2 TRINITY_DN1307_c0_g13~~TRINITY_DN1307_c0_g13_i1.p2  ORF type:complete len:133 (-),score=28.37 TRINITY_DN1307_c0_g13_i1:559-957(-)
MDPKRKGAAASSTAKDWAGSGVPVVRIDTGVFKYVLMTVYDGKGNEKVVVRGSRSCEYHMDVFEACKAEVEPLGLQVREMGGGRIRHSEEDKAILVYGYSQAFGQADHQISVSLLRECFPTYDSITMSNEGY